MSTLESNGSAYIQMDKLHKNPEQIDLVIFEAHVGEDDITSNAANCNFVYTFLCD